MCMKKLIRQLSLEAIENCITCLNYCFDTVVFVGEGSIVEEESKNISSFLKGYCGVSAVVFKKIDNALVIKDIIETIEGCIDEDECYIDLTGGEGLCEAALVQTAYSHHIPMHIYDVRRDVWVNVDDDIAGSLNDVKSKKIKLTIDKYIKMVGGVINNDLHKGGKNTINPKLFELRSKYSNEWNGFCNAVQRSVMDNLHVSCRRAVNVCIDISLVKFYDILNDALQLGIIKRFQKNVEAFCFDFVDEDIKHAVTDTGSLFEQNVFEKEKSKGGECRIGVHLDWDGIISGKDCDVLNEIDVLKLEGNILTFISCKDTKKLNNVALYELESIARRFGGNYARMKIATRAQVNDVTRLRAKEMGIEIEEY